MVAGFESFKNWFQGYEKEYVIIGGAACDMLLSENEIGFRLLALLSQNARVDLPDEIREDMTSFLISMNEEQIDLKQLGLSTYSRESIISFLKNVYLGEI